MPSLNEMLIFEYESEYNTEYDLSPKKQYSDPKIYSANGDLSKRWYVYFSYRNPETWKLERMKNIYGNSNIYRTKEDRLSVLTIYRKKLLVLLNAGFNPFEDNIVLHQQRINKADTVKELAAIPQEVLEEPKMTLKEAFDFGLKLKEKLINSTTANSGDIDHPISIYSQIRLSI